MHQINSATVSISDAGIARAIGIGDDNDGPLGLTAVALDGGVIVWVDPLRPESVLRVEAFALQPDSGAVLTALFGAELATALTSAAESTIMGSAFIATTAVVALDPELWPLVSRLGFLLWLEEYSLLALDQGDLDIEIAVVADKLSALGLDELVEQRLERSADHLVERVDEAADRAVEPVLLAGLRIAVNGYLDHLGDERVDELDGLARSHATSALTGDTALIDEMRALHGLRKEDVARVADVAASPQRDTTAATTRQYSVDWRLVPRNILATAENTVTATWSAGDSPRLSVEVTAAAADSPISRTLMFGVRDATRGEYRAAGALEFDAESGLYRGECHLAAAPAMTDEVEVYSVLSTLEPARGPLRARLRGARQATRAFLIERTPNSSLDFAVENLVLTAATEAWLAAANAFGESGGDGDDFRKALCEARQSDLDFLRSNEEQAAWLDALPPLAYAEKVLFSTPQS